jgi:hypothetical protein
VTKDYLLVIGDREPLAWVLTEERMAFPAGRSRLASDLTTGDRFFLYTTRGCFRNPTRDRGRVIGEATVTRPVTMFDTPIEFGDRSFPLGCSLELKGLVPRGTGPELHVLVNAMHLFPDPKSWSVRLRQVLVPIDAHDADLLDSQLAGRMRPADQALAGYLLPTAVRTDK